MARPFEDQANAEEKGLQMMKNAQAIFDALRPMRLGKYQWRQRDPQRLHNELREVWALVTKAPGLYTSVHRRGIGYFVKPVKTIG